MPCLRPTLAARVSQAQTRRIMTTSELIFIAGMGLMASGICNLLAGKIAKSAKTFHCGLYIAKKRERKNMQALLCTFEGAQHVEPGSLQVSRATKLENPLAGKLPHPPHL